MIKSTLLLTVLAMTAEAVPVKLLKGALAATMIPLAASQGINLYFTL
jgi:hypothetical protein